MNQFRGKCFVDSVELAEILNVSRRFIEKNRHRIPGAIRIGRLWRFNLDVIRRNVGLVQNTVDNKPPRKKGQIFRDDK